MRARKLYYNFVWKTKNEFTAFFPRDEMRYKNIVWLGYLSAERGVEQRQDYKAGEALFFPSPCSSSHKLRLDLEPLFCSPVYHRFSWLDYFKREDSSKFTHSLNKQTKKNVTISVYVFSHKNSTALLQLSCVYLYTDNPRFSTGFRFDASLGQRNGRKKNFLGASALYFTVNITDMF